jgi:hypothetical protein
MPVARNVAVVDVVILSCPLIRPLMEDALLTDAERSQSLEF